MDNINKMKTPEDEFAKALIKLCENHSKDGKEGNHARELEEKLFDKAMEKYMDSFSYKTKIPKLSKNKNTKIIPVILNRKYEANYTLKKQKNKKGEIVGVLTAPYVEWVDPETSYVACRVLILKDRELECIEKYFFDECVISIPVEAKGISCYDVEICDICYKVTPPKVYEQMISGTFKIAKKARNPEDYEKYIKREKENKLAIKEFINQQKKLGVEIKPRAILYARKLYIPSSSDNQPFIVLINKPSKKGKYKIQIHNMNPDLDKKLLWQKEFDDIYDAKKMFDNTEINNITEEK